MIAYACAPFLYVTTSPNGRSEGDLNVIGVANPALMHSVDRPMVLAGRLPDPVDPFEVTVNELVAQADHLHVGSTVHLYAYTAGQFGSGQLSGGVEHVPAPKGPSYEVRVAAVVRFPQDVAVARLEAQLGVSYEGDRNLYVTPAFLPRLASGVGVPVQQLNQINLVLVRLRHGPGDWKTFASEATAIGGNQVFATPGNVWGVTAAAASAQRGIHLDVVALVLFGTLAALVTLALVGQSVARQTSSARDDYAISAFGGNERAAGRHRRTPVGVDRRHRRSTGSADRLAGVTSYAGRFGPPGRDPSGVRRRPG